MTVNLNEKFNLPKEELEDRLKLKFQDDSLGYDYIVPLRNVQQIERMNFFRQDDLKTLIRNIPLRRSEELLFPYAEAEIDIYAIEPKGLAIGQTFVLKDKILDLMFNMGNLFSKYVTRGISKMPPVQVYGLNQQGQKVMAFYIPPVVEKHDNLNVLLDGMHRSTICSSAGTTISPINVSKVSYPLPFSPITWKEVQLMEERPPVQERYHHLDKSLFRDLGYVGIDG